MARKILLADDSVTAQNMGRKILADAGYEVFTVNNGSAALKRITETRPDLIVLDVYMPGYSGLEVCQRLKESSETSKIPVLLTVGKLEPFKPEEARRVRADAHIIKPFEASELLSALARLEDRMVPTADGSRFSSTVTGLDRFSGDEDPARMAADSDADTGWKKRLTFPSKKKKKEEPEEPEDAGNFREYRKGKGKAGKSQASTAAPAGQEPGLVPDIPRDITPEELDALSALAAKLDGPIPAAEEIAPLAEEVGPTVEAAGDAAAAPPAAESKESVSAPAAEARATVKEFEIAAPATEAVEPVATRKEIEIQAPRGEAADEVKAVASEVKAAELPTEKEASPVSAAPAFVPVNAGELTQEPAPVDRQDEPMFAAASETPVTPVAPVPSPSAAAEEKVEAVAPTEASATAEPVVAKAEETPAVMATAAAPVEEPKAEERKTEEVKTQEEEKAPEVAKIKETKGEEPRAVEAPVPVEASAQENTEPEVHTPSDEELAEALRLLTPATGHGDSGMPSQETLMAAGQLLAEESARVAAAGSRWMAEAVPLTPEEAAMSLEEEMFRTFAAAPAGEAESPAVTNRVSVITAAVESRMAEAGLGADGDGRAAEMVKQSAAVSGSETASEKEAAVAAAYENTTAAAGQVAEHKDLPAAEAVGGPEESEPPATFADVAAQAETETSSVESKSAEAVVEAAIEHQNLNLESGGQEEMAKDGKGKSSKSNWHQIHTPASPVAKDAVEAAKQAEPVVEAPKAMAAAATGESGPSAADAGAIANIVDSVLADLRPKIVEEIAKKLGKK